MTRAPRKVPGVENRLRRRRDGSEYYVFRVRWMDPATGKRAGQEFDAQSDAVDFKAHLRLMDRSGVLADVNAGRELLSGFTVHWWETYAGHNLAVSTLKTYAVLWNKHALPRVGHLQLRQVTPGVLARLRTDLEAAGTGAAAIRKTMALLQAILRYAVELDRIKVNPAADVRKPAARTQRAVRPLPPVSVEAVRAAVKIENATLISVLAYAGLRPEEALALEWRHVRKKTILIEQKTVDGQLVVGQKVLGRAARTVDLLDAPRQDLAALRIHLGGADDSDLVFPRPDGQPWRATDYRNWRRRKFRAAALTAGLATPPLDPKTGWTRANPYDGPRPYDLRHSFASLLIHEGRLSIVEIATQLGHSTETLLRTYSHIFSELRDQPKIPANQQIAQARDQGIRRIG